MPRPLKFEQQQNYIARIRYTNELQPPECPPKMVAIPSAHINSLASTSFISTLGRTDSVNVDIDAECGMPLDGSYWPGVYDGTNAAIPAISNYSHIHPTDRQLLNKLGGINPCRAGAPKSNSFLRRTEYISAEGPRLDYSSQKVSNTRFKKLFDASRATRAAAEEEDKDPVRILQAILRGFDTAYPDSPKTASDFAPMDEVSAQAASNWKDIEDMEHPGKPGCYAVDSFPVLPDLEASSDTAGYMVFKFATGPIVNEGERDTRLDVGLLRPHEPLIDGDSQTPAPQIFDYYLPINSTVSRDIKNKLLSNITHTNTKEAFPYEYIRAYEVKSYKQLPTDVVEDVALIFHEGDYEKQKGFYYYPIVARYVLQPHRTNRFTPGIPRTHGSNQVEREEAVERLNVSVRELNDEEIHRREVMRLENRFSGMA